MLRTREAVLWKLISTERENKLDKEYGGADGEIRPSINKSYGYLIVGKGKDSLSLFKLTTIITRM